jgi:hypothetical protein
VISASGRGSPALVRLTLGLCSSLAF